MKNGQSRETRNTGTQNNKQINKHNTENQNDEQHEPHHKPGVIQIIKQLYVVVFLYLF